MKKPLLYIYERFFPRSLFSARLMQELRRGYPFFCFICKLHHTLSPYLLRWFIYIFLMILRFDSLFLHGSTPVPILPNLIPSRES